MSMKITAWLRGNAGWAWRAGKTQDAQAGDRKARDGKAGSAFGRLLRDRRAGVSMMAAATLPVLVSFTAMGIDMARIHKHRRLLQDTASAAALAGSSILPDTAANVQAKAIAYAQKNMPVAQFGNVLTNADIQIGTWNSTTRVFTVTATSPTAVRVTVRSTAANSNAVSLFFTRLLGFSQTDLTATATATFGTQKSWDIAIIQDITASLNSTDMTNAKAADQSILSCVQQNYGGTSQVAISSFTGYSGGTHIRRGMTSVGTSSNYTSLQGAISGMNICGNSGQPACSGTNIASGIQQGANFFTGSYTPGATGADFAGKAIILVTDGAPNWNNSTATNNGQYGTSMGGACTGCTSANGDATLANNAIAQADAADAAGISLFVIYLDQGGTTAERNLVKSLVRGQGRAYTVSNSSQLTTAMFNICATVPRRLVD